MFQEKYGIEICVEKKEKDYQGANKGTRNVAFCRYWVRGRQEGHLHMKFIVSSIARQGISNFIATWYEYWTEKEIYKNIIKSSLHRVVVKTLVLPCLDVIEWITQKLDHDNREILNCKDKSVASYKE